MSRLTAIAAIALCWIVASFAYEHAPILAQGRSILDLSEPDSLPFEDEAEPFEVEVSDNAIGWTPYNAEPLQPAFPADDQLKAQELSGDAACGPMRVPPIVENPCFPVDDWCNGCRCASHCDCQAARRASRWFVEVGAAALQSDMATSKFEAWPDDFGPAGRLTIGHEWEGGWGIRTQAWSYAMRGEVIEQTSAQFYSTYGFYPFFLIPGAVNQPLYFDPYFVTNPHYVTSIPIELFASTVFLEFYKSIQFRNGELAIGMGPAFGHLRFNFPPSGNGVRYNGGGITLSGDGYYSLVRRNRWEIGMTGRSRLALLTGHWKVEAAIMESQPNDSMSIMELGVGPELRFKLNSMSDSYCFLQGLAEFHQWRSDRMGPTDGDTLGLQGASLNLGVLW